MSDRRLRYLNEQFYSSRPWQYFELRLNHLVAVLGAPDALVGILKDGVTLGQTEYRLSSAEDTDAHALDGSAFAAFATVEAETLGHHLAESLLRLYLAHRPDDQTASPIARGSSWPPRRASPDSTPMCASASSTPVRSRTGAPRLPRP